MQRHHVNMIIYKSGEWLFVHATAPSEEEWVATRGGPLDEKWNRYMTNYLETDADGNIVFEELERAFSFGEFKSGD